MANPKHLELLDQGKRAWNAWRRRWPQVRPDLGVQRVSGLEHQIGLLVAAVENEVMPGRAPAGEGGLSGRDFAGFDLHGARLRGANLSRANLLLADLRAVDLRDANLTGAILTSARLDDADLRGAILNGAVLRFARLRGARLDRAMLRLCNLDSVDAARAVLRDTDLSFASLNEACLRDADLSGSFVYGCSAWNVDLTGTLQRSLRITRTSEGTITVDDLKTAQFIHTLLHNENVRNVLDTVTTKVVLILGRFTPARKAVLEAVRTWLRGHDYVPVIFDFEGAASRDLTETVVTLAHLARFIVADLTDSSSLPKELEAIVPRLAVPVQPLILEGSPVYAMFQDYWKYDWVLPPHAYRGVADLRRAMALRVVRPAELKADELVARRASARRDLAPTFRKAARGR